MVEHFIGVIGVLIQLGAYVSRLPESQEENTNSEMGVKLSSRVALIEPGNQILPRCRGPNE